MGQEAFTLPGCQFLERAHLADLLRTLASRGFTVIAPVVHQGAVRLQRINDDYELPRGVSDWQSPGRYQLETDGDTYFDFVVGPDSAKRYLFPMEQKLMTIHAGGKRFIMDEGPDQPPRLAFFGLRPCDLAAVKIQDRVFGYDDPQVMRCESEPYYSQARTNACFIAVNCTRPGGNCFCSSMGTGPAASDGFDLALTELRSGFVVQVGSQLGKELAGELNARAATSAELELADLKLQRAWENMCKQLDTNNLPEILDQAVEHPHWDEVAKRCLSCGNCTMVCPTCFCSTVTDSADLSGTKITRTRRWESCYTHQFSYTTGGPHRHTIRARYRQWLRHKLGTWQEQFGTKGCVGCGRCITWCPVGIDITQEVAAIRATSPAEPPDASPHRVKGVMA